MNKAKKKEVLSLEEKLEQVLISVDAQEYEVPENWCWVKIESLVEICLGLTHTPTYVDKGIPFLSVKDITGGCIDFSDTKFIAREEYESLPYGAKPQKGDILFARVGTIGAPQIVETDKEFGTFVSLGFFRTRSELISKKYIAYWINSILFEKQVSENVKGSTLKNLNTGWLRHFHIPVPPASEQQRIVEQIESLFAKLDEAKEKISDVSKRCDDNMASIVHEAITGKLTEAWRIERGIRRDEWLVDKLGNLGTLERGRSKHRPRNDPRLFGGPYPFIQTGDVAEANVYIEKHRQTLSEFGFQQSRLFYY